jgi:hypothetical protein
VADEITAYVELWDSYPEVIVIDNAMNVEAEMGEEHAGLRLIFKELHRWPVRRAQEWSSSITPVRRQVPSFRNSGHRFRARLLSSPSAS